MERSKAEWSDLLVENISHFTKNNCCNLKNFGPFGPKTGPKNFHGVSFFIFGVSVNLGGSVCEFCVFAPPKACMIMGHNFSQKMASVKERGEAERPSILSKAKISKFANHSFVFCGYVYFIKSAFIYFIQ